ncbi:MAG: cation diffusion facilitator family transporter [Promethearchaeota archaeon]
MSKTAYTGHLFQFRSIERKRLILSLSITLIVLILEIIGGLVTNSIALISDAGHMFTHAFAIAVSLLANFIAGKPSCHHKTFGMYRAEVLAAFINGILLIPIVGFILYESILRFISPKEIFGYYMLIVAFIGLGVNLSSIIILQGSKNVSLNIRSVFYHMIADAASSIGIVIAAIIIIYTGLVILDPIVSIGISIVIIYWAYGILKESTRILLEMAPKGMNIDNINEELKKNFPEIIDLYNAHLWTIIPNILVYSVHIKLNDKQRNENQEELILKMNDFLSQKFKIIESTIQIIPKNMSVTCNI